MFDDILGNVNEQQEVIEKKLKETQIEKSSPNNYVTVAINGKKDILDITINKQFEDNTELEDLLVLTLNDAMKEEMRRDSTIIVMGCDVGNRGGPFGITKDLLGEFGGKRVIDTPISEAAFTGGYDCQCHKSRVHSGSAR